MIGFLDVAHDKDIILIWLTYSPKLRKLLGKKGKSDDESQLSKC